MPLSGRHLRSVLALSAIVACSRIANQSNFIGAPCKSEADCSSGLVCADDAVGIKSCQRACLETGGCEDPDQVCSLGACRSVPSSLADAGSHGASSADAARPDAEAEASVDAAPKADPGFSGVGQTLAILTGQELLNFTTDGTWIAYARTGKNAFGVFETVLEARRADGTSAGAVFDRQFENGKSVPAATLNGSLYWIEGGVVLKKAVPGAPEVQVWTAPTVVEHIKAIGQELFMLLQPATTGPQPDNNVSELNRFDLTTNLGNIFETTALRLWNPAYVAANEQGAVFWAHGSRNGVDLAIYTSTPASGSFGTTARIPANMVQFASFGVTGTRVVYAEESNGTAAVRSVDTAVQSSPVQTIANIASSGVGVFEGNQLYLDTKASPGGGPSVSKLNLTTGTPASVVSFPEGPYTIRVRGLDATNVYWSETLDNSAGRTIRIARAPK